MEGPSLYLASKQLAVFKGKQVRVVSGNTKIDKEKFLCKKVEDVFSWGKHLVFQFNKEALRVHFMLFGTFEATVNGESITGDYKRTKEPRLMFQFSKGKIKLFNCSLKVFETDNLKSEYDFSIDIMSPLWDKQKVLLKIRENSTKEIEIADMLLDQEIFAGVGNIIKNEVLSILRINPKTHASTLDSRKLITLISVTHEFSRQFYLWREKFVLRKNLKIYQKTLCPHCGKRIIREKTGKKKRWSYYCLSCQHIQTQVLT